MRPIRPITTWILPAAIALAPVTDAMARDAGAADLTEGGSTTGEAAASAFASAFFRGDRVAFADRLSEDMSDALDDAQYRSLLASLADQLGALESIGAPWPESDVQGFQRYRIPLAFAADTLDMRLVFDGAGDVAGLFFVPHLARPSGPEPEAPVREEDVIIGGDPETGLGGTLSLPDGPGPFPALVLVHGSGPNDRDETIGPNKPFRDLAWGLATRGVAVLRYDKRSYARPETLQPLGTSLTVAEEVIDDALDAVRVVSATPGIDATRVFLCGHSLGGTLAHRIAATDGVIAGVIVLAGATLPLPEKIVEQTWYIANVDGVVTEHEQRSYDATRQAAETIRRALDGEIPEPEGPLLGAPVGYYRDLGAHDPVDLAWRLRLPTLVLQGDRDYQVTLADFSRWEELRGEAFACLVRYPDLDHLFHAGEGPSQPIDYERPAPVDARVIDDMAAWIEQGTCRSR